NASSASIAARKSVQLRLRRAKCTILMRPLLGILLQILAMLCFTLQGAIVRYLSDRIPLGEIVFARSFVGLVPLMIWLAWQGRFAEMWRTNNLRAHLTRGIVN